MSVVHGISNNTRPVIHSICTTYRNCNIPSLNSNFGWRVHLLHNVPYPLWF